MAQFHYTAIDKAGNEVQAEIEASSVNEVLSQLREKGLFSVEVIAADKRKAKAGLLFSIFDGFNLFNIKAQNIKQQDLVIFTRQLSVLLDAGLSLVRALNTLHKQARFEMMRKIIGEIINMIESGRTLSDALAQYPASFSNVYINIVRAGETGGALDVVLKRLADYLERNLRLTQRIHSALIYPILVLCVAGGILGFIISFVIPRFMELFADSGVSLPFLTVLVLNVSNFFRVRWYIFVIGIVSLVVLYKIFLRNYKFRYFKDRIKLKLPVFGVLIQKIIASRFARTLSTLMSGGVHILQALELSKEVSDNEVMAEAIDAVYDSVREGGFIARVLENSNVFPQLMIDMVAVGEESGSLDKMLAKVADTYEEEVEITTNTLTALLEPALIIVMGVIVGIIVLSMFLPIITLIDSLS